MLSRTPHPKRNHNDGGNQNAEDHRYGSMMDAIVHAPSFANLMPRDENFIFGEVPQCLPEVLFTSEQILFSDPYS